MNSNIQDILNCLEKVKSTADNKWTACCPAHADKTPSLSIAQADDGKVLMHCHAGCSHNDVVKAMGLTVKDPFAQSSPATVKQNRILRATYDYLDHDGTLLYQIMKYADGKFSYRRPDGNSGLVWKVDNTPKILYHLPELVAADKDQIVFIPEGEKDVDNLIGLGLLIGTIQPGPLESYIHEAVSGGSGDDGFIQRFQLSVWPDDPQDWQIVDRWPDKDARQLAWEVFQDLDRLDANNFGVEFDPFDQNGVPYLRFDPPAQDQFYDWMRFNENRMRCGTEHPALESHFAKYRSMVPSLALLIHLADK